MQQTTVRARPLGAVLGPDGVHFRVWAPDHEQVELPLFENGEVSASYPLYLEGDGYFGVFLPGIGPGARYQFWLAGSGSFPDPASRYQPEGVHGPSEVVDLSFPWGDSDWTGRPLEELVIYELHVGTATPAGTFEALVPKLPYLRDLGVTAIELMPVADFPGKCNWGYDGVSLWAPSRNYGGPRGLQTLVDAAHAHGIFVLLDVVYNHLGPDGNYLRSFARDYFTDRHRTPWGDALNFDGSNARPVRDFFIGNALYWLREYHLDGLRLDATHTIRDDSEPHILAELAATVRSMTPAGHDIVLIAEDERNERRLLTPVAEGGYGLDAVWADDLHHQLRRALAGDSEGYYADYSGSTRAIARTLERGWFYEGQHSEFLAGPRGTDPAGLPYPAFIHCIQNHDQSGNRAQGDRLNHNISLAAYRAASTLFLLDPATPLLFMGQEWAASTPFLFFTDFEAELGRKVTEGRRAEFKGFSTFADEAMRARIPDPQAAETFLRSKLVWGECELVPHAGVLRLYRDLLHIRREHPAARTHDRAYIVATDLGPDTLALRRAGQDGSLLLVICNLRGTLSMELERTDVTRGCLWRLHLSSEEEQYGGEGSKNVSLDEQTLTIRGPGAIVAEGRP